MGLVDAVEDIGDAVMDAGKGIAQVFNHAGPLGNPIPVIGALSKLVTEAGSRVVDWVKGGSDKVRRTANSPILQGGQLVIAGMRRTTGTGEPDPGDQFGQGSNRFHEASQVSATAEPTDDWTGSGADAYAGQNGKQRGRAMTMADLDREVETVIAREALQIDFHRGKLDDRSNWLADVGVSDATMLGRVTGVGPAMTAALETQAVIAAVGSSSMELGALSDEVSTNAAAVRESGRPVRRGGPVGGQVAARCPRPRQKGQEMTPPIRRRTANPRPAIRPTRADDAPPSDTSAPSSGGGGDTAAGNGPASAAAPPAPTTVPNMTLPTLPQAPMSGGGPAASGGMPGALGGLPSALGGAPAGPGAGGAASALGPLIQAARPARLGPAERRGEGRGRRAEAG